MVTTNELKTKIKAGFSLVKGEYISDLLFMMRETTIISQEQYSELMNYISELETIRLQEAHKLELKAEVC